MTTTSKIDSSVLSALARRGRTYLTLSEDHEWLQDFTSSPALQLSRMARRGTISPLGGGRYVVLPPGARGELRGVPKEVLLAALFSSQDYYLGYLSALAEHRLTDETSDAVYVAVKGLKRPAVDELGGVPLRITTITGQHKWFGLEKKRAQGTVFYFRSDLERTLLDTLDKPRLCGRSELWVRCWERAFRERLIDIDKLHDYSLQMSKTVAARSAFWLKQLGAVREADRFTAALGPQLTGQVFLDSSKEWGDRNWSRDRDTGLIVNIPATAIAGWLEYGK